MAGGGGANYFPTRPDRLQALVKQTLENAERQQAESDVNAYLQQFVTKLGQRDPEKVNSYLDAIGAILGQGYEIDRFLFGGSVAKHTFVDGLSDVDALVVLDRQDLENEKPNEVLKTFFDLIDSRLTRDAVSSVRLGDLAVTVVYRDGTEIQLLPAIRYGKGVCIADSSKNEWKPINPKAFQRTLSKANQRLNFLLVPTIKLAKSILDGLPEKLRPESHHVEALTIEATKGYRGPATLKALLLHVFTAAAARVLRPIRDTTNQSKNVDEYLGRANSEKREKISLALASVSRRMNAASTIERWKEIVEP